MLNNTNLLIRRKTSIKSLVKTVIIIVIGLAYFLFTGITNANTIDNRAKFWTHLRLTGRMAPDSNFLYLFELQGRIADQPNTYENTIFHGFLGYQLNPKVNLWFGYHYSMPLPADDGRLEYEQRLMQQVYWYPIRDKHLELTARTRLEERKNMRYGDIAYRFRQRIIVAFPIASRRYMPVIAEELIFNLNHTNWTSNQTIDQNRALIGMQVNITDQINLLIGYQNQYIPGSGQDEMGHILYMSIRINRL